MYHQFFPILVSYAAAARAVTVAAAYSLEVASVGPGSFKLKFGAAKLELAVTGTVPVRM
jgi:hypothetical protein